MMRSPLLALFLICVFAASAWAAGGEHVPPPRAERDAPLYDRGAPIVAYPKYFSFLADPAGLGGTGVGRMKVKRRDPESGRTREYVMEFRQVGEILASGDGGTAVEAGDRPSPGRLLLSVGDTVMLRFTEDLAKLLDSDTYEDPDPYFREYPIYGLGPTVREPDLLRLDHNDRLGAVMQYRGKLTVLSRVESLAPISASRSRQLKNSDGPGLDMEPVSYVARITYAEDAIRPGDRIFVFVPLQPGPERRLEAPFVEQPGTYVPLGY